MSADAAFFIHEKADNDLEDIFEYGLKCFGLARATRYINDIEAVFLELARNPHIGKPFDSGTLNCFHKNVESHSIYYRPCDNGIEVFRILHKRMLPSLHLE